MKRTLAAAAAVMASSAGAVGFAGTAFAVDPASSPTDLAGDNNVAEAAFHATGTMHAAQRVVGDVVPVKETLSGKADVPAEAAPTQPGQPGQPATPAPNGLAKPIDDLSTTALGEGNAVQETMRPMNSVLSGRPQLDGAPVSGVVDGALNSQGIGPGKPGGSPLQGLHGPQSGRGLVGDAAQLVPELKAKKDPVTELVDAHQQALPLTDTPIGHAAGELLESSPLTP